MIEQSLTKTKIRIAIAYLTFALIPILVLGIFTNFVVLTHLKDDSEHALKMEAFIIAETLKDKVEATVAVATLFSKRRLLIASIKKGDPKDVTRHLQSFIDGIPDMERVTITNLEGKVIYTSLLNQSSVGLDFSDRDWYKVVKKTWKPYISDFFLTATKPRLTFSFGIPVLNNGKPLAIMNIIPTADYIEKTIRPLLHKKITTYVLDKSGKLVYHSGFAVNRIIDYRDHPAVQMILQGKEGTHEGKDPIDNIEKLGIAIPLKGLALGVVAEQPASEVYGLLYKMNYAFAAIIVISIVFAITGALVNTHLFSTVQRQSNELSEINKILLTEITERKQAEEERERLIFELKEALSKVKTLSGFLPICASCKKIRNDKGYWEQIEVYIRDHSEADFSHGICPACAEKLYPKYYKKK